MLASTKVSSVDNKITCYSHKIEVNIRHCVELASGVLVRVRFMMKLESATYFSPFLRVSKNP